MVGFVKFSHSLFPGEMGIWFDRALKIKEPSYRRYCISLAKPMSSLNYEEILIDGKDEREMILE